MNGEVAMGFPDSWLWLVFVIAGVVLVLLELVIGVETGLDLVFIGSAFVIGGLVSWPFHSWWESGSKSETPVARRLWCRLLLTSMDSTRAAPRIAHTWRQNPPMRSPWTCNV